MHSLALQLKLCKNYLDHHQKNNFVYQLFQLITDIKPEHYIKKTIGLAKKQLLDSINLLRTVTNQAKNKIYQDITRSQLRSKSESNIKIGCVLATTGYWIPPSHEHRNHQLAQKGLRHLKIKSEKKEYFKQFVQDAIIFKWLNKQLCVELSDSLIEAIKKALLSEEHPNLDDFVNQQIQLLSLIHI